VLGELDSRGKPLQVEGCAAAREFALMMIALP
jgi:hypothetical protein